MTWCGLLKNPDSYRDSRIFYLPAGRQVRFLIAKLVAETTQLILYKHVTNNMKATSFLSLLFLIIITTSCNLKTEKTEKKDITPEPYWNLEKAKKQALDYNSSEKWETKTLEMEVESLDEYPRPDFPLYYSPFPTPKYYSPGNGNGGIETQIANKNIIGHYAIIAKGEHSEHLFEKFKDTTVKYATYVSILTISDGKDSPSPTEASSRNHPNYFSQGSLNTSTKSRVDWVALQLADKNAYAVVNGRIFDLRVGRLILVAPQIDGSIRFYQTDAQPMNSEERENYIEKLKTDEKIIEFFKDENNI